MSSPVLYFELTNLNVEKTPTIISDTARLTSKKFMGVLIDLSFSTTRQTSEFPSKLIATMTEHRDMITLDTMLVHTCVVILRVCFPTREKREELHGYKSGKVNSFSNNPTNPSSQRTEWYRHFPAADIRRDMLQRQVTATCSRDKIISCTQTHKKMKQGHAAATRSFIIQFKGTCCRGTSHPGVAAMSSKDRITICTQHVTFQGTWRCKIAPLRFLVVNLYVIPRHFVRLPINDYLFTFLGSERHSSEFNDPNQSLYQGTPRTKV